MFRCIYSKHREHNWLLYFPDYRSYKFLIIWWKKIIFGPYFEEQNLNFSMLEIQNSYPKYPSLLFPIDKFSMESGSVSDL